MNKHELDGAVALHNLSVALKTSDILPNGTIGFPAAGYDNPQEYISLRIQELANEVCNLIMYAQRSP